MKTVEAGTMDLVSQQRPFFFPSAHSNSLSNIDDGASLSQFKNIMGDDEEYEFNQKVNNLNTTNQSHHKSMSVEDFNEPQ